MRTIPTLVTLAGITLAVSSLTTPALAAKDHVSPYAGQENRTIKSLSADEIADLQNGAGMGLALAAELNGVPGPTHLLLLKDKIGLTPEQVDKIQIIYDQMKADAIVLGNTLIAQELELEERFRTDIPSEQELKSMLTALGDTRAQLRFVHLATHLKTPDILTDEQVTSYIQLRGYASDDPCTNVPEGHDAAMWKKMNGCG